MGDAAIREIEVDALIYAVVLLDEVHREIDSADATMNKEIDSEENAEIHGIDSADATMNQEIDSEKNAEIHGIDSADAKMNQEIDVLLHTMLHVIDVEAMYSKTEQLLDARQHLHQERLPVQLNSLPCNNLHLISTISMYTAVLTHMISLNGVIEQFVEASMI